ncbi:MAG: hypothetical protein M3179_08300 [Actinomycetota bacterium]|nr:hypothetical protein [Actinomycetota bacterium]
MPVWVAGIVLSLALIRPGQARRLLADGAVRVGLAVMGVAIERFPLPNAARTTAPD